jgi:hypothetical protein
MPARHRFPARLPAGARWCQPYLAISVDGGSRWSDLSASLPGDERPPGEAAAEVTSLVQDPLGRILLTLNLAPQAQGRLLLLTLGGVD